MSPRFGDELARVLEVAGVSARETRDLRLEGNRLQGAGALAEQIGDINSGTLHPDAFARGRIFSQYPGMGANVFLAVAQSIPTGTATVVHFDGSSCDTNGFVDLAAHDDRLTVPAGCGGLYLVWGKGVFDASGGGSYRRAYIIDSTETWGSEGYAGATTSYSVTCITPPTLMILSAGGYVQMQVSHDKGSNMTCNPQMWLMRVV